MRRKRKKVGRPLSPYGFNLLAKRGDESLTDKRDLIFLSNYRTQAIQDQGATEETLSANRLILTDRAVSVLGLIRMIEKDVAKFGVFLGTGKLHPILEEVYPRYVALLKTLLKEIGIERRADGEDDLLSYVEEKYGKEKPEIEEKQSGPSSDGEGHSQDGQGQLDREEGQEGEKSRQEALGEAIESGGGETDGEKLPD